MSAFHRRLVAQLLELWSSIERRLRRYGHWEWLDLEAVRNCGRQQLKVAVGPGDQKQLGSRCASGSADRSTLSHRQFLLP